MTYKTQQYKKKRLQFIGPENTEKYNLNYLSLSSWVPQLIACAGAILRPFFMRLELSFWGRDSFEKYSTSVLGEIGTHTKNASQEVILGLCRCTGYSSRPPSLILDKNTPHLFTTTTNNASSQTLKTLFAAKNY